MTASTREEWQKIAYHTCFPVLNALANQQMKDTFVSKKSTAHLEACCRVLVGIAPWIELNIDEDAKELNALALRAISSLVDPSSKDFIDFSSNDQILVEAALLSQAFLRAFNTLWCPLSPQTKQQVIASLKATRKFTPHNNNWELFPTMIETFLKTIGEDFKHARLWRGLKEVENWYRGDGIYGDGQEVHMDYYNSFIIHPMLYDILTTLRGHHEDIAGFATKEEMRLQRWAILQERMIAPDGTFPAVGRSITYRCGAFHALALCAFKEKLPMNLNHGTVRVALTRVIKATLEHPDTFEGNWLTIGLYGKQPSLAEPYINHGSVYMCCTVFLPLGLHPVSQFWTKSDALTTWEKLSLGQDTKRDTAYIE